MKLPDEFIIKTLNGFYTVVHRPEHSGLDYELYELWAADGQFHRHLTELEIACLKAGYEHGKKEK